MKDFKLDNERKISAGFNAPEGYFDSFPNSLLAKLPTQESNIISLSQSKKLWYYAIAAVVTLMLSIPVYNNYRVNEEIDLDTLENYVAYHATLTEDDIVDLLQQEDLDKMSMELNIEDAEIEDALKSNSNLEEYIIN